MRTSEERQRLIHKRIIEIQREERRKRQDMISVAGIVACLPKATQLMKSASGSPSLRNLLFTAKVYLATHVAFSP